ncbi:LamG-like jellyroll fold domain-containing protein, partial [Pilimelia columellifera]|uniref:LamG-like jellyroll fold domain-containing protein n=1 Tax=Pilimelia columellifera TaxID=706574 RepID=UPI0031DCB4B2
MPPGASALRRHALAALALILVVNLGTPGVAVASAAVRPEVGERLHRPNAKPVQRWGSAEGLSHLTGTGANGHLPRSTRSRFPLRPGKAVRGANGASFVTVGEQPVAGYVEGASVELPQGRAPGLRLFQNPDGTLTSEFAVDPDVAGAGPSEAMYVHGESSVAGGDYLYVGRGPKDRDRPSEVGPGSAATYLKFGTIGSSLKDHTILGAQLAAVQAFGPSCQARPMTVHPVTAAWSAGGGYAWPGPAVGRSLASRSFNRGFVGHGQSQSSCPAGMEAINLGAAGTKLVQGWANGGANNGLSLRAATDAASWKVLAGSGTANRPKLYVTHSPYNAGYAIPDPRPNPEVTQAKAGKVKVTVTNRSAAEWTVGAYYLAYRIFDAKSHKPVGQQRSAALPGPVAVGRSVTLDATIQALPPGAYLIDFSMVYKGKFFTDYQVPPGRLTLHVFDKPADVREAFPPNGYSASVLTPTLLVQATDPDALPNTALQYKFELCDNDDAGKPVPATCVWTPYSTASMWTVPVGRMKWSKSYTWSAVVKDTAAEVPLGRSMISTAVPQPAVISKLAGAPQAAQGREFDAQVGNVTFTAVDATLASAGPDANIVRTYNSLDPRRDGAFGAGWVSRFDMRLTEDADGSGNRVVTYPDGQAVRFGKNPDGTFAAPSGRVARLWLDAARGWSLKDRSGTTYRFGVAGRLLEVEDRRSRRLQILASPAAGNMPDRLRVLGSDGKPVRTLSIEADGKRINKIATELVDGVALTWTYHYEGDLLRRVCGPAPDQCASYEYGEGSHYRTAVHDARPESHWRLGEPVGAQGAGSDVGINLGKDAGTSKDVTFGVDGAVVGSSNKAAKFNGQTSVVKLPMGALKKSRNAAVELWFKLDGSANPGPLLAYQNAAFGSGKVTQGVPILYVDRQGFVQGQFATGKVEPIRAPVHIRDGKWHHVVLSAMDGVQTLYLDGVKRGELKATTDASTLDHAQIGAGEATGAWPEWFGAGPRSFGGTIDEVALYLQPLTPETVAAHHALGQRPAHRLTRYTLPSGRVAAEVDYDANTDRVAEYTDGHGGTWEIGRPTVYGDASDLRRSVQVLDPRDHPYLYEYDALSGQMLRSGTPLGITAVNDDPSPNPSPTDPGEVCTKPDPGDPTFCTEIPTTGGGPVFVRHPLKGMAIRSFEYDPLTGQMRKVVNESGFTVELGYDKRGNVTTRRTCRTLQPAGGFGECSTVYSTFPAQATDPFDPLSELVTESRDGRSASPTDGAFLTKLVYTPFGETQTQTGPDGATVKHDYTIGFTPSVDGNYTSAGLIDRTVDANGKATKYEYFRTNDLARVTQPTGLVTEYTYDVLGRRLTEKVISDSYPGGAVTSYTYDRSGRVTATTGPVTRNAVTGAEHQLRTVYEYDADGNLTATIESDVKSDAAQRVTRVEYDEHGNPVRVTDAEGGETTRSFDRFGNKVTEVDASGNRHDYRYTAAQKIAEVRLRDYTGDPAGAPRAADGDLVLHSYSYDYAGRLASDTDAMGRRLEYQYYGDDLLHRIVLKGMVIPGCDKPNPADCRRDYVVEENRYDAAGHLTQRVTANGMRTEKFEVDPGGRMRTSVEDPGNLRREARFVRDANGNVVRTNNYGLPSNLPGFAQAFENDQVEFDYDAGGRVTEERTRDTLSKNARITRHRYDQRGLLLATTDPRGTTAGADPDAYTTSSGYDELERRVSVTLPDVEVESGSAEAGPKPARAQARSLYGYDAFGDPVAVKDPRGNVSRSEHDRLGRPVAQHAPAYTPPGADKPITPVSRTAYDAMGNVLAVTDPAGAVTRMSYDQLNRLVTKDLPGGDEGARAVWRYTYYRTGEVRSVTDPTGAVVESTYDELDRLTSVTQVERRPVPDNFTTTMRYDDAGNLTSTVSPSGAVTVHAYDSVGDRTSTRDPHGVVTKFGYDYTGRLVRTEDGLGRVAGSRYDKFGQQSEQYSGRPVAGSNDEVLRKQTYEHDAAGNLIAAVDPYGTRTTYAYDALNRLARQVEPVSDDKSVTTSFGYDIAGNRVRYTDGRGHHTFTTVNSWNMPESVVEPRTDRHPELAQRTWTVAYDARALPQRLAAPGGVARHRTYDQAGRLRGESGSGAQTPAAERRLDYDPAGRLVGATGPSGANTFRYNDRGALIGADGPAGKASFTFDGDGNLTARTDRTGTATFGYDKGRLSLVADAATRTVQQLRYDRAGSLERIDYGAGRVRSFAYDKFGQLETDTLANSGGGTAASITYAYDLNGHLTGKKTAGLADAGENSYAYDLAGRLASWTGPKGKVEYDWDASGNRVRAGPKTAKYDERNRLLSDGDYTYDYTERGTLASRTSSGLAEPYSFDAFDRLVTAGDQRYVYDGLDRVASRNDVAFSYAGLSDEPVGDGEQQYARGPADELLAVVQGGQSRLTLADGHDDVVATLDPADEKLTTVTASTSFDPFGQVTARSGDTGRIGFQGDWTDPGTGQVNMGARWYQPGTGAFVSRDSANYAGGDSILANRYTYGAGAPLDFNDPDGHWPGFVDRAKRAVGNMVNGAVNTVRHTAATLVKSAVRYAYSAIKTVANWVSDGAKWLYNKAKAGVNWVVNKVSQGWQALKSGYQWAKERAMAAAKAAYQEARQITQNAKAAIEHAVKHTVLPVLNAVTKPLLSGLKVVVSAAAKLPAAVVSVARQAVADPGKFLENMYQQAAEAAGTVIENVSNAAQAVGQFVADNKAAIIGAVAGVAVGIGCGFAIGWTGVGAVACGALAGAVGSAVTGAMNGERGMDLLKTTVTGALIGGITAGLGSLAATGLKAGFGAVVGGAGLRGGANAARSAVGGEARDIAAGRLTGGAARGRGCNSFAPATAVLMADKTTRPIADVKVGELVLATDPTTGRTEKREVTDVIVGDGDKTLVEISIATADAQTRGADNAAAGSGNAAETDSITATDGHEFWVVGLDEWVRPCVIWGCCSAWSFVELVWMMFRSTAPNRCG